MRLIPYVRRSETPSRIWPETTSFFEDFFNDPFLSSVTRPSERWLPAVDILEKEGNLILRAEVPGVNEKDIDLKLEGNVLILKGEKKLENEEERNNYHRMESFYGSFTRSFTLPDSVDRDHIKADYKNGILVITIPQKPEVRPREIPVSTK
ncbi:MAG: Hsp20/alpha crystallin family protein [Acidobacteriia bacterium]|nr:Hsp20/alpha crystallin family protein [Terriglobia bacterium]